MTVTTLVENVLTYLQEVQEDPSKKLDERLLESVDSQVTEAIQEPQRDALLNRLSALLPSLQQDPTPALSLIKILVSSSHPFDFSRVLAIQPPIDFLAGLTSPLPPVNSTVLTLLETAKFHASDIGIIAGKPEVVGALIRLWLCTSDTGVALQAHGVLSALLLADAQSEPLKNGPAIADQGLLWRRIFRDKDIYGSIFSLCSLSTAGQDGQPSKRDKSVAQARLWDMLCCIDSEPVRTSQLRDVEESYGVKKGGGLLHFAAIHMVDYQDDVLMHMMLINFCASYLSGKDALLPKSEASDLNLDESTSFALQFLREVGIHKRIMSYYLSPESHDSLDLTHLYGPAANYLAVYCSTFPQDVLKQRDFVDSVLSRLTDVLQTVSPGQWAQGRTPKHDLSVMASLPRTVLIPRDHASPFFLIPVKSASPDTFQTLARVFNDDFNDGTSSSTRPEEKAAARALFFLYTEHHTNFWTQLISCAETVAVKDVAIAAIGVISAVITADWDSLPTTSSSESPYALPSEKELMEKCQIDGVPLPQSGIKTIMSNPAISIVVPYLMRPAQTFSNLVGGGRGDVESAAYQVAVAKYDALILLHQRLQAWVGLYEGAEGIVATVGKRVAQGPMGGTSEVGGRVGTLDL